MPLQIPARKDVSNTLETYVRGELPTLDPTPKRRSKIGGWVKSLAGSLFDWYVALKDYADHEPFPQTARGDFLMKGWWRDITKLNPIAAAPSRGIIAITGTSGTAIPAMTEFQGNGFTYKTDSAVTILPQSIRPDTLIYDSGSGLCVAEFTEPHFLAVGMSITVSGAAQSDYNGTFGVVSIGDDLEVAYKPASAPGTTPATGSPLIAATWAAATVTAQTVGMQTNIGNGGTLALVTSISGVDTTAIATFGGVSGGTDDEKEDAYRLRILKALGTDFGAFTGDEIEIVARTVAGVTRVWVKRATLGGTNGVYEGQVKVAFMRDGDTNPFPTTQEVNDVKAKIIANCMTSNTAEDDVIVRAPIRHDINVSVSITPDSTAMRSAVKAALTQFFGEAVDYEKTVALIDLQCTLRGLIDPVTRARLTAFSVASPSADVTMADNEMPTLGTVTFT